MEVVYLPYRSEELDLQDMMDLIDQELSEPYNIYTFRYFLQEWPHLCYLAYPPPDPNAPSSSSSTPYSTTTRPSPIACIISKLEKHRGKRMRGYIAMLSVERGWRRKGIARKLAQIAIDTMTKHGAEEIVLETEYDNSPSLALYASMGFMREKRLHRFYLNGKDAFRLVLPVISSSPLHRNLNSLPNGHPPIHSSSSQEGQELDQDDEEEETPSEIEEARDHIGQGPAYLSEGLLQEGSLDPEQSQYGGVEQHLMDQSITFQPVEERPGDMYGMDYTSGIATEQEEVEFRRRQKEDLEELRKDVGKMDI